MTEREKRLREALREAYSDIAWNAYCTGYLDGTGMFDNCCVSDPEWLQGAVTGSRKRRDAVKSDWLKAQINDLADAMVMAVVEGVDPYEVCLGRKPE